MLFNNFTCLFYFIIKLVKEEIHMDNNTISKVIENKRLKDIPIIYIMQVLLAVTEVEIENERINERIKSKQPK